MDTSASYKLAFANINKVKPDFSQNDNYLKYHMNILNPNVPDFTKYTEIYGKLKIQYMHLSDAKKDVIIMAWTLDKIQGNMDYMCGVYSYYKSIYLDDIPQDIEEIITDAAIRDYILAQDYQSYPFLNLKELLSK